MIKPIPLTGGFQTLLTSSSGNHQVQCFSANEIHRKIASQIGDDYYTFITLVIESFDIASNISNLNKAPLPDITDIDSRSEQATKIYNNWMNYEKVGIQLLYDDGQGIFRKQGQPILLQNIPFQLPVQHLRPYLSATQNVLLVGEKDRIGVQVLSFPNSDYKQLSGDDQILVKGQWKATVELFERKSQPVTNWRPIGVDLPANEPKIICPENPSRRMLYFVNSGSSNVRFFFGHVSTVLSDSCPYLTPNGAFNQTQGQLIVSQQLVALSVNGDSRLVGMEGSA